MTEENQKLTRALKAAKKLRAKELVEVLELKQAYEAKVQKKGKTALKELLREVFGEHPELEEIRWYQYTPYWNDGEPCEFKVRQVGVRLRKPTGAYLRENLSSYHVEKTESRSRPVTEKELKDRPYLKATDTINEEVKVGEYTDEELVENLEEMGDYQDGYLDKYSLENDSALHSTVCEIQDMLEGLLEVLEMALGDHLRVTANRKTIEVDEYEHE